MRIDLNIDDSKVNNFTSDAKNELKNQLDKFSNSVISESQYIIEATLENGATPEITGNTVIQAARKSKIVHSKKNSSWLLTVNKIVSSLSLTITGFIFEKNMGNLRLLLFLLIFAIACITTVIQFICEGKE